MRSFLKPWSMRAKYCVPLRIEVAPNEPWSITGKPQGTPFCAGPVPHIGLPSASLPKTSCAVCETVTSPTPTGWYVFRKCVPTVLG